MQKAFKDIIERLEDLDVYFDNGDFATCYDALVICNDVRKIVNQVAEEYKQDLANNNQSLTNDGWIPCSERLPEVYGDTKSSDVVLVCGYDKESNYSWQAMGFYVHTEGLKRWFFAECKDTDKPIDWIDVVAWQPLPEPYRGE